MNENIENAIKMQYQLKLKIPYFLATKLHCIFLVSCYFLTDNFTNFSISYAVGVILLYRFIFKQNRLDNPYKIFLLEKFSKLIKKIKVRK